VRGCLQRVGCLTVLAVLGVAAWLLRDQWWPVASRDAGAVPATPIRWESVTDDGAARARSAVASMAQRSGPVFTNIGAGDLIAWVLDSLARRLPPSSERPEAAVIGDRIYLRLVVRPRDLGGSSSLGPMAALLGERDTVQFGGTARVVRPGLGEFQVVDVRFRELSVPERMIPRLLRQIDHSPRPPGVDDDAWPVALPPQVADVRIANGHVTLYKAVP
jgi:hypothetical protein